MRVRHRCTFVRSDEDKKSIYSVIMSDCSDEDIRIALKSALPKYMLPQKIINSTDRPKLTKNGKIDKRNVEDRTDFRIYRSIILMCIFSQETGKHAVFIHLELQFETVLNLI